MSLFRCSVIIPYFNCSKYIDECIDSVLSQNEDVEIILVDDKSTESNTFEILDKQIKKSSNIVIVSNSKRLGPAYSRNAGIEISSSQYFIPLDSDNYLLPNSIRTFLKCIAGYDCCFSWKYVLNAESGRLYLERVRPYCYKTLSSGKHNFLDTCGCFSKSAWEDVSGYDSEMEPIEDWDFWLSMGRDDKRIVRVCEPLFVYRERPDSFSRLFKMDEAISRLRHKHKIEEID